MRKFLVEFIVQDDEPCNDNRDLQAIREIIIQNFGDMGTYTVFDITVKELQETEEGL